MTSAAPSPFSAQTTVVDVSGVYPTGTAGIMREWDGQAWTDNAYLDARAEALQPWHRGVFGFLASTRFWLWVACFVASVALSLLYISTKVPAFIVAAGVIGPGGTLVAFYWMISSRLDLFRFVSKSTVIWVGLLGGVVGFAFAFPAELLVNHLLNAAPNSIRGFLFTGPIEEFAKLLVPLVFYLFGKFRQPLAGFGIALASAVAFGWIEGIEYVAGLALESPQLAENTTPIVVDAIDVGTTISRPFVELLHPVLVGFVAATAWRIGWVRGKFWSTLVLAWLVAAVLHSLNDMSQAMHGLGLVVFPLIVVVGFFALTLRSVRQLTPPHQIGFVAPVWRPTLSKQAKANLTAPPIG